MQEIHRDLTKHHSLTKPDTMNEILERSVKVDRQISAEYSSVELMRAVFEEVRWQYLPILAVGGMRDVIVQFILFLDLGGDVTEGGKWTGDIWR